MSPAFLTGLDMLKQMQGLTGCCDTQPPVVVYRDRPAQSQPAAAAPVGGGYAAWAAFHAGHISEWLTLDQLRAECGRLASVGAPSPELLLSHAMRLLDAPAAVVPDGWVLVPKEPTPEMRAAYHGVNDVLLLAHGASGARWAAMLAAAPQAPQQAANEADPLTQAIKRLLSVPHAMTKGECIQVLRELRAELSAPPATPVA